MADPPSLSNNKNYRLKKVVFFFPHKRKVALNRKPLITNINFELWKLLYSSQT